MDLWDCAAVVTGAASGLGAETARHLAEAGAKVAAIDIDQAGLEVLAAEIGALAIPCDVADAPAAEAAIAKAKEANGPARVLINCVGQAKPQRIVDTDGKPMPLDDFRYLVEVNLRLQHDAPCGRRHGRSDTGPGWRARCDHLHRLGLSL